MQNLLGFRVDAASRGRFVSIDTAARAEYLQV
jgi:hypothetical protein